MTNKDKPLKYLAIDWGEKRIGLAIAEPGTNLALPFKTVENLKELLELLKEEEINIIILGEANKLNSTGLNPRYLQFKEALKSACKLRVITWDEKYTSKMAELNLSGKKKKELADQIAASIILQDYLDSRD